MFPHQFFKVFLRGGGAAFPLLGAAMLSSLATFKSFCVRGGHRGCCATASGCTHRHLPRQRCQQALLLLLLLLVPLLLSACLINVRSQFQQIPTRTFYRFRELHSTFHPLPRFIMNPCVRHRKVDQLSSLGTWRTVNVCLLLNMLYQRRSYSSFVV